MARVYYGNFTLNSEGNCDPEQGCGHKHKTAPEAFLCPLMRSERKAGIAATFKVFAARKGIPTPLYERVIWVAEDSGVTANPPGTNSPLEAAWALTRIAKNVPISEEGRFLMMDCNNAAMDLAREIAYSDFVMIRERVAEAQQRLGYVGGLA